jgi:hypothetical protein
LALAGASAALLVVLVAIGTAAAGIKYVPDVFEAPAGSSASHRVDCPASHPDVTGGGIQISGDNSQRQLSVSATNPGFDHARWFAGALNDSSSTATLGIIAICGESSHLSYANHDRSVPGHENRATSATCPSGTKLIGGGVSTTKGDIGSTKPNPNSPRRAWFGVANNRTGLGGTMFVDAVCAPKSGNYKYVHSAPKPLPDNSEVSARAKCPAGTNVTGGGVDNSGSQRVGEVGAEVANSIPFDTDTDADSHPDDGWQGSAQSVNTGRTDTLRVFAICKVPATHFFSGSFTKSDPAEGPATMSFALTHDGKKVHDWTWHHMPVHCAEGDDVNSSHYTGKQDVKVRDHHFLARGVPSDEGFKTTLEGFLTHHNTKAHGSLTMHGPEPPTSTKCHGTDDWHANVQ